jgi:hypothetical protein
MRRLVRWWRSLSLWDCPICGESMQVKAGGVHLHRHAMFDPELVQAWRERS